MKTLLIPIALILIHCGNDKSVSNVDATIIGTWNYTGYNEYLQMEFISQVIFSDSSNSVFQLFLNNIPVTKGIGTWSLHIDTIRFTYTECFKADQSGNLLVNNCEEDFSTQNDPLILFWDGILVYGLDDNGTKQYFHKIM